ncbi:hypothetical protein E4U54_001603, partial [Claviceps lovelessii]
MSCRPSNFERPMLGGDVTHKLLVSLISDHMSSPRSGILSAQNNMPNFPKLLCTPKFVR